MSSSDLEKGAGAHASSDFDHDSSSHPVSGDFPPKYESQVNIEMQRFREAQPQAPQIVDIDYDTLAPSQRKQGKRPMWLWAIVASAMIAMIIGAVIIAVHIANQKRDKDTQASPSSSAAEPSANTTQTAVITRSEPDASRAPMTMSPALQPVSRDLTTVTVQPITSMIYVTVTPPTPSTTTVVVVPSEPTSLSTPVVTVTSTMAASTLTSVATPTAVVTSTLVASSSTPTESSSTSSTSVSLRFKGFDGPLLANGLTSVMSGVTLSTSTTSTTTAFPTTETVVSTTTDHATETVSEEKVPIVSTAHPFLFRCSVPGLACGK